MHSINSLLTLHWHHGLAAERSWVVTSMDQVNPQSVTVCTVPEWSPAWTRFIPSLSVCTVPEWSPAWTRFIPSLSQCTLCLSGHQHGPGSSPVCHSAHCAWVVTIMDQVHPQSVTVWTVPEWSPAWTRFIPSLSQCAMCLSGHQHGPGSSPVCRSVHCAWVVTSMDQVHPQPVTVCTVPEWSPACTRFIPSLSQCTLCLSGHQHGPGSSPVWMDSLSASLACMLWD